MLKRIVYGVCGAAIVGLGLFSVFAWNPAIDPITSSASTDSIGKDYSPDVIEQGRVLAAAGYCDTCHTPPGGAPYASNFEIHTECGTIYSSNITPDVETGIGGWSEAAFTRAMREGISRDGSHLLPAFPYEHFNKMSDDDIRAIYAYIMTSVPAVEQFKKKNGIPTKKKLKSETNHKGLSPAFTTSIKSNQGIWIILLKQTQNNQITKHIKSPNILSLLK